MICSRAASLRLADTSKALTVTCGFVSAVD
jgi:hypothetical protein